MPSSKADRSQSRPASNDCVREWKHFLELNSSALFQLTLLVSGDGHTAEMSLIESVDDLDFTRPPRQADRNAWEDAAVARSIATFETAASGIDPHSRSLLQSGLWPVLHVERLPRICFVLRILLGYSCARCAGLLNMEQSGIERLLRTAIEQLHQVTESA